tara:strand:- start:316 stop:678 length:363 start_codon:yes stop_codon:yes gene_type:complete
MNPAQSYILSQPEPWRSICLELQAIIKHTLPEVDEQFKWHLPFYKLEDKMLCFLNVRKTFVDLGFIYGIALTQHQEYLVAGEKRKQLRSLRFNSLEEINPHIIRAVLKEAALIGRITKKG